MFQIYLPIAEMSVHLLLILSLGGATGVLSGMFGVGGGFLTTPLLIFLGIPPQVAVATSANQVVASSVSGFLAQLRRKLVDFRMGNVLLVSGIFGSSFGVWLFQLLQRLGQIDLVISLTYVTFLTAIGLLMGIESLRSIMGSKVMVAPPNPDHWSERLPWQMHFPASERTISLILPASIGFGIGILVSLMGVGGGFFMIPAMIYLLRMPASLVIGTSLYQIIFITANVTILHAVTTQTVDLVLALLLLSSSVIGAQIGARIGTKMKAEQLRGLLALLILLVAFRLAYGLFVRPDSLFIYEVLGS